MSRMTTDLGLLLPELLLAGGAVAGLLLGSYLPRQGQWPVRLLAVLAVLGGLTATVVGWGRPDRTLFEGSYAVDVATDAVRLAVLVSVLLVLGMAAPGVRGLPRESEFVVLLLLAALGAVVLAGAHDLLLLAAGYLLASVPLYALIGFGKDALGTEAAMKYYLMGAMLGVVLLFGVTTLLGAGGASAYGELSRALAGDARSAGPVVAAGAVLLLAGLFFKAGAVPAQFWVPDVTQGALPSVGALVTTVPKLGALVAVSRVVGEVFGPADLDPALFFGVVAAATMTLGNLAAFFQTGARRLLAYSTISQVGYLLLAVAALGKAALALPGLLLYLTAYAVTNLGAFAVVCALPAASSLEDFRGLLRTHRWLALSLVVCLLGLVGTPPTAVFTGKLAVFTAALDAGLAWLVVLALANTLASLFYYLRWLVPAVRTTAPRPVGVVRADRPAAVTAYAAAAASLLLGPLAGPVLAAFQS